jgi:hypothetical protein
MGYDQQAEGAAAVCPSDDCKQLPMMAVVHCATMQVQVAAGGLRGLLHLLSGDMC